MTQKSARRLELEEKLKEISGDSPWNQSDMTVQSRLRYSRELANICQEEGDYKAVYSHLLSGADFCATLAKKYPNERWQSMEAELHYFLAHIAYRERHNMHDWSSRTSQHVSWAKRLDPQKFKNFSVDDL